MIYGGGAVLIVLSILFFTLGVRGISQKSRNSAKQISNHMSIPWQEVAQNRMVPPKAHYGINVLELTLSLVCFLAGMALVGASG